MKTEAYIHIPFCVRKCAYCDFLSFPAETGEQRRYADALREEIRSRRTDVSVDTVFIGGGTPSVLPAEWIAEILEELRRNYAVSRDAEISIEVNPGTADAEKLRIYQEAGINRISFGCQSFLDEELRLLGRIHSASEISGSVKAAREAGFDNINLDLMSGIPGQTLQSWEETLLQALYSGPEHISAYSLIIEEGTPFYEWYGKKGSIFPSLPDEETERLMYERTAEILSEAGYRQYEISNYAKEGYACRHNVGYWTGVPYMGFGLGASSFLPADLALDRSEKPAGDSIQYTPDQIYRIPWIRCRNTDSMEAYLDAFLPKNGQTPAGQVYADIQALDQQDLEAEFMILGLRMTEGIEDAEFRRRFGYDPDLIYGSVLDRYEETGFLIRENGRTRFSRKGISVSNVILADFL